MNKLKTSRDRLIFFIFLSILLHFLFFSFYIVSMNKTEIPLFEIVDLSQNNSKDEITNIRNDLGVAEKNRENFTKNNSSNIESPILNKKEISFIKKNKIINSTSKIQNPSLPRRHTVSAETKDPIYAGYVEEWRRRVEIIGNLYYPQDLALKGISGDLLLDAAIDRKGKIKSIRILRTSGNSVLDNAAINIVKLASPFSPLPEKIIEETDILHITRTWKFSNKGSNLK